MSTSDSCKDGASKSNDDVCDVNDKLQNMNIADEKDNKVPICANCGKEGANNICNKCKQVKYCNAVCKKIHKKKHKKDCEEHIRRATERHNEEVRIAAELHDIKLFNQPPPKEDCPICFLRLPTLEEGRRYQSCCGKVICSGCVYAPVYDNQGNIVAEKKCPFCRAPKPTEEESIKREKKRVEMNDPIAIYNIGHNYYTGMNGLPQDHTKASELWHRAAELGYAKAFLNLGYFHEMRKGVKNNKEKATYYYELAAMMGDADARHNLGARETNAGNVERVLKHHMIAVRGGNSKSLQKIKGYYTHGHATKEDYTNALQLYQAYLGEIKSVQRDKAAAFDENYRYY